jgi:hypothetical protein
VDDPGLSRIIHFLLPKLNWYFEAAGWPPRREAHFPSLKNHLHPVWVGDILRFLWHITSRAKNKLQFADTEGSTRVEDTSGVTTHEPGQGNRRT